MPSRFKISATALATFMGFSSSGLGVVGPIVT
jgi:hypothetical protein